MQGVRDIIKIIPTCVQLQLDSKYQGKTCLGKIAKDIIGKMMTVDQATSKHEKLQFVRVMMEIQTDQHLPNLLSFINDHDKIVLVVVFYEWKLVMCSSGHEAKDCMKPQPKKVWRAKMVQPEVQKNVQIPEEGAEQVKDDATTEFGQVM